MRNLILLFSFLSIFMSKGVAVAQESQCNCSLLLEEAVKDVSAVYAGYSDKVTSKTRSEYDRRYQSVLWSVRDQCTLGEKRLD